MTESAAKTIDTGPFAQLLRSKSVDVGAKKLLISRLGGSDQEADLSEPVNCCGFGRVRHFRRSTAPGWPTNPLPIDPACVALGFKPPPDEMRAQVFQNAACPWRCWYCYVPFALLSADPRRSEWVTADELVHLYANEPDRALILDLSGGSPDLAPEWTLWTMQALEAAQLDQQTYLWSDDNLSTTYLWDELSTREIEYVRDYPNYGRVACFKGYDDASFEFNTRAHREGFSRQFEIMKRLLEVGFDVYGYATFTSPTNEHLSARMAEFVDRLQSLDAYLPLRLVPLHVDVFSPVEARIGPERERALGVQEEAVAAWSEELSLRYSEDDRKLPITGIQLEGRR